MSEEHEYVLGQDVTEAAASKTRAGTVVLSVRMTAEELAAVEAVAQRTGKNLSQVVREAIRDCVQIATRMAEHPFITVSVQNAQTTSIGSARSIVTETAAPAEFRLVGA